MAGDDVALEAEIESALAVVLDVLIGEEYRYFHRNGDRVIDQHEALQGFMSLLVVWRGGQGKGCESGRIVLFPHNLGMKISGNLDERCSASWKKWCGKCFSMLAR